MRGKLLKCFKFKLSLLCPLDVILDHYVSHMYVHIHSQWVLHLNPKWFTMTIVLGWSHIGFFEGSVRWPRMVQYKSCWTKAMTESDCICIYMICVFCWVEYACLSPSQLFCSSRLYSFHEFHYQAIDFSSCILYHEIIGIWEDWLSRICFY